MAMTLKFKELKKYISTLDRLSICMRETLNYENYHYMRDVPDKYDEYYVYGIGRIKSEFKIEKELNKSDVRGNKINDKYFLGECLEVMLAQKPRDEFSDACTWSEYAYAETRYHD